MNIERIFTRLFIRSHVFCYRLSGGRILGRIGPSQVLLLTTTGSKSGKERTTPLIYLEDGPNKAVIASNAGRAKDSAWWGNLKKHPECEVQIGGTVAQMRAREATAEEYGRLWDRFVAVYPTYEDYRTRTDRAIPIVILMPAQN